MLSRTRSRSCRVDVRGALKRPMSTRCSAHRVRPGLVRIAAVAMCCWVLWQPAVWAETTHVLALARTLDEVLTNIRNWIMALLALVATVFLTLGGLRYVASNGEPGELEKAKQALRNAGIGYLLTALAPVLVDILRQIVGA